MKDLEIVLVLNELGLDPGIDHMSAKKMIDEVELSDLSLQGSYPADA